MNYLTQRWIDPHNMMLAPLVETNPAMKAAAHQSSIFAGLAKGLTPAVQISVLLALLSFIFATFDAGRKERLEFVRGQIANLYGPLFTLAEEHERLWADLGQIQRPFDAGDISTDDKN